MSFDKVASQSYGLGVCFDCRIRASLVPERISHIPICRGAGGVCLEGQPVRCNRIVYFSLIFERVCEVVEHFGVSRPYLERPVVGFDCLVRVAGFSQGVTKIVVSFGEVRLECRGSLEHLDCLFIPPHFQEHHPELLIMWGD